MRSKIHMTADKNDYIESPATSPKNKTSHRIDKLPSIRNRSRM
jgi:hypothetical protein